MKISIFVIIRIVTCCVLLPFNVMTAEAEIGLHSLKAFPTAEGAGATSIGGRNGKTVFVDRLEDDGQPGSLRWALTRPYPRVVVFLVGGEYRLRKELVISGRHRAFLTIAGETARNIGGVHITGARVLIAHTNDVIVRYVDIKVGRSFVGENLHIDSPGTTDGKVTLNGEEYEITIRPGDEKNPVESQIRRVIIEDRSYTINGKNLVESVDALTVFNVTNFIADHCTFGWAGDEAASITGYVKDDVSNDLDFAGNATIQRSLFLEGVRGGSTGSLMGTQINAGNDVYEKARNYDQHHNAYIHLSHRFFNASGGSLGVFKNINNVVYGWVTRVANIAGNAQHDIINNYYKQSPMSLRIHERLSDTDLLINRIWKFDFDAAPVNIATIVPDVHLSGNIIEKIEDSPEASNWKHLSHFRTTSRGDAGNIVSMQYERDHPSEPNRHRITVLSAKEAFCSVINNVGSNVRLNRRGRGKYVDPVDRRYVNDAMSGSGPLSIGDAENWEFPVYESSRINRLSLDDDGVPLGWRVPRRVVNYAGYSRRELYLAYLADDYTALSKSTNRQQKRCMRRMFYR